MNTFKKIDDTTLEVTNQPNLPAPVVTTYNIDQLKKQELAIIDSINNYVSQRKEELTNVRDLITQAESLGIKSGAETAQVVLDNPII